MGDGLNTLEDSAEDVVEDNVSVTTVELALEVTVLVTTATASVVPGAGKVCPISRI